MSDQDMGDDADLAVTQRVVPAGDAPATKSQGFASVFAMGEAAAADAGGSTPPPATEAPRTPARPGTLTDRAYKTFAACGPLTVEQVANALGIDRKDAVKLCANMRNQNMLVRLTVDGEERHGLHGQRGDSSTGAPPSGFKGWLARQATAPKADGKKTAKKTNPRPTNKKRGTDLSAGREAALQPLPLAKPSPRKSKHPETLVGGAGPRLGTAPADETIGFVCGLMHTGELLIEDGGQQLRLTRPKARAMVQYLLRIDAALQA